MNTKPKEIRLYRTQDGLCPFEEWVARLKNNEAEMRIDVRLARLELGTWVGKHLHRLTLQVVLRPEGKGFVLLPRRWAVERMLAWLNQYRRLSKDYERLTASSEAMSYIAMTRIMVRRLTAA